MVKIVAIKIFNLLINTEIVIPWTSILGKHANLSLFSIFCVFLVTMFSPFKVSNTSRIFFMETLDLKSIYTHELNADYILWGAFNVFYYFTLLKELITFSATRLDLRKLVFF